MTDSIRSRFRHAGGRWTSGRLTVRGRKNTRQHSHVYVIILDVTLNGGDRFVLELRPGQAVNLINQCADTLDSFFNTPSEPAESTQGESA